MLFFTAKNVEKALTTSPGFATLFLIPNPGSVAQLDRASPF